jgi:hypothetical protein
VHDAHGPTLCREPIDEGEERSEAVGIYEVQWCEVEIEVEVGDRNGIGHELEIAPGQDVDITGDRDDDPVAARPDADVVPAITPAFSCHAYVGSRRAGTADRGPTRQ